MDRKISGEHRKSKEGPGSVFGRASTGLRQGRAVITADLRRLQGHRQSQHRLINGELKGAQPAVLNPPDEVVNLIHWRDPSPELTALFRSSGSRPSLHEEMSALLERCSPMFMREILAFLGDPGVCHEFDTELDRGKPNARVLRASLQCNDRSVEPLSDVLLCFSQPDGYVAQVTVDETMSPTMQCFFDNSREGMVMLNTKDRHTILTANPAFCAMLGLSLMSLEGRSIHSLQPAGMLRDERSKQADNTRRGLDGNLEMDFVTSSGDLITVSSRIVEIRNASGHLTGLSMMTHDVSEFKRATRSIHRSETRLAIGEALAHMGSWEHDLGRDDLIWTDELYRIFEMPIGKKVTLRTFLRHVMPADREQLFSLYRAALYQGNDLSCDIRILTNTGRQRNLRVKGRVIQGESGQQPRLVGMAQDITERQRSEKVQELLLEISEATSRSANLEELLATVHRLLGTLVPASNFYITLFNPDTRLYEFPFYVDEHDEGFHPQRMDDSLTDIVRREGRPLVVTRTEQAEMVRAGRLTPYGPMSMSWLGVPMSDAEDVNGVIVLQDYRIEGVFSQQDVDLVSYVAGYLALAVQRRLSSDRVRESEWQYRNLVDTMFEGLSTADENGNFVYVNPALGRIMGIHPEKLVGRNINEFLSDDMQKVAARQGDLRREGSSNRYEMSIQRADGQERELYLSVSPRYDRNNRFIGSHALVQDVTEMRQAEQALRDNEQRYRTLVDQMSEGLASVDAEGVYEFANPALERIVGVPEGSVVGRSLYEFMDEEQGQLIRQQSELRRQGHTNTYMLQITQEDGGTRTAMVSASPRFDANGEFLGSLALVQDVTEKMQTERILKLSEEKYRKLVNDINEGIFVVDNDNLFTYANPALERMFGVEVGGLTGRSVTEFLAQDQQLIVSRQDRLRQTGMGSSYRLRIRRHDGQTRECMVNASPNTDADGSFRGASGIVQDITEQETTLELLRANEEKFRHIYHNSPVMMYSIDSEGYIIDVNQKWLLETGYNREDVIGHRADFLMTPESAEQLRQQYEQDFSREGHIHDAPFTYICRDGSLIEVLIDCEMSVDPSGRGVSLAIVRNVTEQNAAENQLRQVVIAVENAHEAIMTTDAEGTITYVNPAFETITGFSREEAIGSNPSIIASGRHDNEFYAEMWQAISRGEVWHGKFVNRRKDGSQYQEDATISPVRDSRGEIAGYVAVKRDVTQQLAMEEQLKQSQKMEAIGTLAGGIAHDFNNILFAIVGNAEIAIDSLPQSSSAEPYLQAIVEASSRATDLVKQVLSYARKKESNHTALRVDLLVREVLKLIRASLPATVEIEQKFNTRNATVLADATEIHQLLMNLCTNAGHAMMNGGGTLSVELREVLPDMKFHAKFPDLHAESYLRLDVSDTGEGILPKHMQRIFEPFFTTKEVGKGTGMGLSVVHGIVHSLKGAIDVESTPGQGTVFSVYLPLCRISQVQGKTLPTARETGRERILLVDDEKMIVDVVSDMLALLGYRVESYESSLQAWQEFSREPSRFDVVLTDQTMPQLTGDELSKRILAIRPDIPIIMCTGFSQTLPADKAIEIGIREYLHKPVKLHDLGLVLRRVLAKDEEPGHEPPASPSSSGAQ